MPNLFDERRFPGLAASEQAKRAIGYTLRRIRTGPHDYYQLGLGSEVFSQLTETYAALTGDDLATVRRRYLCPTSPLAKPQADGGGDA